MWRAALASGLLVVASAGASPTPLKRVAGKAVLVQSICGGGAAITRERIEELPPPQPVAGREFIVVAGDRIHAARPAARFVTRADGSFVTRLPPGTWCFFEAGRRPTASLEAGPKVPAPRSANIDAGCMAEEARRCDLVMAVKTDVTRAEISFTARCPEAWNQPCYRGPMPP